MIQLADYHKAKRKLVVVIQEEPEPKSITFNWLPSAITTRNRPAYLALDDEGLALPQQITMEMLLLQQATARALEEGKPSANSDVTTQEALLAEIQARRQKIAEASLMKDHFIAAKLLLLLDPVQPCDVWDGSAPLPANPEAFASAFTAPFMGQIIEKILLEMEDPLGMGGRIGDTSSI